MSRFSGYAAIAAVVLSSMAVSCSRPVFFKGLAASNSTAVPAAQAVASSGATAGSAAAGAQPTNTVAVSATPATTQPSAPPESAFAFLANPQWNGAEAFGGFVLAFVVMIGISCFLLGGSRRKS